MLTLCTQVRYPSGPRSSPPDLWDLRVRWREQKNKTGWSAEQAQLLGPWVRRQSCVLSLQLHILKRQPHVLKLYAQAFTIHAQANSPRCPG